MNKLLRLIKVDNEAREQVLLVIILLQITKKYYLSSLKHLKSIPTCSFHIGNSAKCLEYIFIVTI